MLCASGLALLKEVKSSNSWMTKYNDQAMLRLSSDANLSVQYLIDSAITLSIAREDLAILVYQLTVASSPVACKGVVKQLCSSDVDIEAAYHAADGDRQDIIDDVDGANASMDAKSQGHSRKGRRPKEMRAIIIPSREVASSHAGATNIDRTADVRAFRARRARARTDQRESDQSGPESDEAILNDWIRLLESRKAKVKAQYVWAKSSQHDVDGSETLQHHPHATVTIAAHHASAQRAKRCGLAYITYRCAKIRELAVEIGSTHLPPEAAEVMSTQEKAFHHGYASLRAKYIKESHFDVATHHQPPKSLFVNVRSVPHHPSLCEPIRLQSGDIDFSTDAEHHLQRTEVESMIRHGLLTQTKRE